MSKYTTEVRWICLSVTGMPEDSLPQAVIPQAIPKIFDFSFPIFNEEYREVLEEKILAHYYMREIGLETVGLWKYQLWKKLNEIMPYYNQLYQSELLKLNPLQTINRTKDASATRTENKNSSTTRKGTDEEKEERNNVSSGTSNTIGKFSDTPMGKLSGVVDGTYLSEASVTDDTSTSTVTDNDSKNKSYSETVGVEDNGLSTDSGKETEVGYDGNPSELLKSYRETFLNIDMQVVSELESLFMGIY